MATTDVTEDDRHRAINYRLCMAIDLTKLGITLDRMVEEGLMHQAEATTFSLQASVLLTSLRNANNRAFGREPQTPIR